MPQAKRRKKRSPSKRKAKNRNLVPWAMLVVGLTCGAVLGALYMGARNDEAGRFGSGIRTLLERESVQIEQKSEKPIESQKPKTTEKAKPKLDYYTVLPEIERVIPEDDFLQDSEPVEPRKPKLYVLQAASYASDRDAERLKAQLALSGFEAIIQRVQIQDKGTYYRVRLGPYSSKRNMKRDKNRLAKLGIRAMPLSIDSN